MAADQRRKRLNGSSMVSYASPERHRNKKKNLGIMQRELTMKSHVSIEWDGNHQRVVAKPEQIGISWRQMRPFANFVHNGHTVLADVLAVPPEIFGLDSLSEVLSYEVWNTHLSESERNFLLQFLPSDLEPQQVVQELLSGNNFHFGNPFVKWGASLCSGDLHPDMIVNKEQLLKSDKRAYYSQLHNYHNDMVGFLLKLKGRWESCKDPEKEFVLSIQRSKKNVEKRTLSNLNFTATSESCSWGAEEKTYCDNHIPSIGQGNELQRRVLEKSLNKGKPRNLMVSSDYVLNDGARPKNGDKLRKLNIHASDGDKYMSYIKISKKQHELVKSMKLTCKSIQSSTFNRVLGDLNNIHVQPYEVFVEEEQKKLREHWFQLVNKELPAAYANWNERQMQIQTTRNSLVVEMKDKSKPLVEDEDIVSSGIRPQDQESDSDSGIDSPVEMSSSEDNDDLIDRSPENQLVDNSYHSDNVEPNHLSMDSEKNILSKSDDASHNKTEYSAIMNSENISTSEKAPVSSDNHAWQPVEPQHSYYDSAVIQKHTGDGLSLVNHQVSEEQQSQLISVKSDLHQEDISKELLHKQSDDGPFSSYQSQDRTDLLQSLFKAKGVNSTRSLVNHQVSEEPQLISLKSDLHQEDIGEELLQRQSDDGPFSSYQNQDRTDSLQSLFKAKGVINSYHREQKNSGLDLQTTNNILENGQFSSHFKEPLQTSLTLDQGQSRPYEAYMPENMSTNVYSDGGRYLIPSQNPLSPLNIADWTVNAPPIATPSQSHVNTGDFIGHNWFPTDHQVHGGWNGSDSGSLSSQCLVTGGNSDQSLFSVLSQYNQLPSGSPYGSVRHADQFLLPKTYGGVNAGVPRTNAVLPQSSHSLDYFSGRETPGALVHGDMSWMSLPPQNPGLRDPTGPPYLRSWNR